MENTVAWNEFDTTQSNLSIRARKSAGPIPPDVNGMRLVPNRLLRIVDDGQTTIRREPVKISNHVIVRPRRVRKDVLACLDTLG